MALEEVRAAALKLISENGYTSRREEIEAAQTIGEILDGVYWCGEEQGTANAMIGSTY